MRTGMKGAALTRRGLLSVLVVLSMTASAAGAETDGVESTRSVPSPYTYLDAVGDNSDDSWPDITRLQIRNGPYRVDLRFRMRNYPASTSSPDHNLVVFYLDLRAYGPGVDYRLLVVPLPGQIYINRTSTGETTCQLSTVSDLGSNARGRGFSARFPFRCIGGRHTIRTQMNAGGGDEAPDSGFTPYVRPRPPA
jgi:hypothetical protein